MLAAMVRDISRLGKEHDDALREYEDCLDGIDVRGGHAKYDTIFEELQDDTLTCRELKWLVR